MAASVWTVAVILAPLRSFPQLPTVGAGQLCWQCVNKSPLLQHKEQSKGDSPCNEGPGEVLLHRATVMFSDSNAVKRGSEKDIPPTAFADLKFLSAGSLGFLPAQKK